MATKNKVKTHIVTNKFYVGARQAIGNGWAKRTEADAILHAQQILSENPDQKFCTIVKVIKIVKRPLPLFDVLDVK